MPQLGASQVGIDIDEDDDELFEGLNDEGSEE